MSTTSTGYGGPGKCLIFDGDERKFELWQVKFMGFLRLQKLHDVVMAADPSDVDEEKNAEVFALLVQCLDDRSISLIIRESKDDGRKALEILCEHYLSKGKPKVISLYTELTSLKKSDSESVTDYMLRAETAATSLKTAGEVVSDSLLIAMLLKGLPSEFRPFSTVITQKDKALTFSEFKVALRSYEETEKSFHTKEESSVMKVNSRFTGRQVMPKYPRPNQNDVPVGDDANKQSTVGIGLVCYSCNKPGHKANECVFSKKKKKYCSICKNHSHDTRVCRKKDSINSVDNSGNNHGSDQNKPRPNSSFVFNVGLDVDILDTVHEVKGMLVDCGATTHIVTDNLNFLILMQVLILLIILLNLQMVVGQIT